MFRDLLSAGRGCVAVAVVIALVASPIPVAAQEGPGARGVRVQELVRKANGLIDLDIRGGRFQPLVDLLNPNTGELISVKDYKSAASAEKVGFVEMFTNDKKIARALEVLRSRSSPVLTGTNARLEFLYRSKLWVPEALVDEIRLRLFERMAWDPATDRITSQHTDPRTGRITSTLLGGDEYIEYVRGKEPGKTDLQIVEHLLNKVQGYGNDRTISSRNVPPFTDEAAARRYFEGLREARPMRPVRPPRRPVAPNPIDIRPAPPLAEPQPKPLGLQKPAAGTSQDLLYKSGEGPRRTIARQETARTLGAQVAAQLEGVEMLVGAEKAEPGIRRELLARAEQKARVLSAQNLSTLLAKMLPQQINRVIPAIQDVQARVWNAQPEIVRLKVLRATSWLETNFTEYMKSVQGYRGLPPQHGVALGLAIFDIAFTFYEYPPWKAKEGWWKLGEFAGTSVLIAKIAKTGEALGARPIIALAVGEALAWAAFVALIYVLLDTMRSITYELASDVFNADVDRECIGVFYKGEGQDDLASLGLFDLPESPVAGFDRENFFVKVRSPEMLRALIGRHRILVMNELDERFTFSGAGRAASYPGNDAAWDRCWAQIEQTALSDWKDGIAKFVKALDDQWNAEKQRQTERERRAMTMPVNPAFDGGLPPVTARLFDPVKIGTPALGAEVKIRTDWLMLGMPGQTTQATFVWHLEEPPPPGAPAVTRPDETWNQPVKFDVLEIINAGAIERSIQVKTAGTYAYSLELRLANGERKTVQGTFDVAADVSPAPVGGTLSGGCRGTIEAVPVRGTPGTPLRLRVRIERPQAAEVTRVELENPGCNSPSCKQAGLVSLGLFERQLVFQAPQNAGDVSGVIGKFHVRFNVFKGSTLLCSGQSQELTVLAR